MKRKLLAGLLATFGTCLALMGALFVCVATFGGNPVHLWTTAHAYYQFIPRVSPWTSPIGGGSILVGMVFVIASLRLSPKRR